MRKLIALVFWVAIIALLAGGNVVENILFGNGELTSWLIIIAVCIAIATIPRGRDNAPR